MYIKEALRPFPNVPLSTLAQIKVDLIVKFYLKK